MSPAVFALLLTVLSDRHFVPAPKCIGPVAAKFYTSINLTGDNALGAFILTSPASALYSDCWANYSPDFIYGRHVIWAYNGYNNIKAVNGFSSSTGSWNGWLNASAVPTWCYFAFLEISSPDTAQTTVDSLDECAPAPRCMGPHLRSSGAIRCK